MAVHPHPELWRHRAVQVFVAPVADVEMHQRRRRREGFLAPGGRRRRRPSRRKPNFQTTLQLHHGT